VACNVEYTDEFGAWFQSLTQAEQDDVTAFVSLLETYDVKLGFPHSSGINGSRHSHMRELRVQSGGKPTRVFTLSIHAGKPSYLLAVTRQAMTDFTRFTCQSQINFMTSISQN
jgi:hypothetical protein